MRPFPIVRLLLIATAVAIAASPGQAGNGPCRHCGCDQTCKVCRLVCEEKEIEIVCWGSKCEEFCIPCRSCPICKHCECVCDPCKPDGNEEGIRSKPHRFVWIEWRPSCKAKMFHKTKLMKRTEKKKLPSYKWVVEDLCEKCREKADKETEKNKQAQAELESVPPETLPPDPVAEKGPWQRR